VRTSNSFSDSVGNVNAPCLGVLLIVYGSVQLVGNNFISNGFRFRGEEPVFVEGISSLNLAWRPGMQGEKVSPLVLLRFHPESGQKYVNNGVSAAHIHLIYVSLLQSENKC